MKKTVNETGQVQKITKYVGGMIFENDLLQHVATEEGRVRIVSSQWRYDYFLKDHLGNVRVMLADNGTSLEETHYYPFGLTQKGISMQQSPIDCGCALNKKGFNGNEIQNKEFIDGSGLEVYDFNARTFSAQIGKFLQVDPLTEEAGQESLSPYQFGFNSPIRYNDPDGKCPICPFIPFIIKAFAVGAAIDVGTQVAVSKIQGQSWEQSVKNVRLEDAAISGTFSVLSAGSSNFVGSTRAATAVTKAFVQTGLEISESASHQYIENKSVNFEQTMSDVVMSKIGGNLTKDVNAGSIKAAENKLDRVSRIAAGDPTSAGRKQNVVNTGNNLTTQQAKANVASAAASSTSQKTSDAVRNILNSLTLKASQLPDFEKLRISVSDNTRVNFTR